MENAPEGRLWMDEKGSVSWGETLITIFRMEKSLKDYKDLTGLLLGPIQRMPALFLGKAKLSVLFQFIRAYDIGFSMAKDAEWVRDSFFNDDNGFFEWFLKRKGLESPNFSTWDYPFLVEANNDEEKAWELFFKYLEEYSKEKTQ